MNDIDFLKANSFKKSFLFFVDSEKRDRSRFPEPNEYMVTFKQPVKNVFALEIIDVSVPDTHYTIDTFNNTISYSEADSNNVINVNIGFYQNRVSSQFEALHKELFVHP